MHSKDTSVRHGWMRAMHLVMWFKYTSWLHGFDYRLKWPVGIKRTLLLLKWLPPVTFHTDHKLSNEMQKGNVISCKISFLLHSEYSTVE